MRLHTCHLALTLVYGLHKEPFCVTMYPKSLLLLGEIAGCAYRHSERTRNTQHASKQQHQIDPDSRLEAWDEFISL
jgi:hypothetical protein